MPNQLSNLIFLRRCSMRPWVLPSVGYVTLVKSMNLICKSGVTGMFRECGEDSRDDAHGRHKTALGTQLALSEYLLSLLIFHLTTWTQELISSPFPDPFSLSHPYIFTHPNSFLLSTSNSNVTPPERLLLAGSSTHYSQCGTPQSSLALS